VSLKRSKGEFQGRESFEKYPWHQYHKRHGRRSGGSNGKDRAQSRFEGLHVSAEIKTLSKKAQDLFELSVQSRILSKDELYAGKICAALDRQHPRDLFDVHFLFKNEGLTAKIRRAFIVYLISHPRPMIEILNPQPKDMRDVFEKEFKAIIAEDVTCEDLHTTRDDLVSMLRSELTIEERRFIVSVKERHPRWDLLPIEGIENLPAVRWKLVNIGKMHLQNIKKQFTN